MAPARWFVTTQDTWRKARRGRAQSMSEERTMAEHRDGRSTAAWTAVVILLVASFLICLSIVVTSWPMAIAGIVLVVVGAAAGKGLAMAGFGQAKLDRPPTRTDVR
jgi:hypothetical protein